MKPKTQQNILYILIPSFILIIVWLAASIYNRAVMTTITPDQAITIQPIADTFDTRVLDSLNKRSIVTSDATAVVASFSAETTLSPTPIVDQPIDATDAAGGIQP